MRTQGEWQEAQALFRLMLSPHSPCRPNAVTFSALISAWLSRGDMRMVKQVGMLGCLEGICGG